MKFEAVSRAIFPSLEEAPREMLAGCKAQRYAGPASIRIAMYE